MKVLALVTDAFGGHGGIAKFNRDLLGALCANPATQRVVALPRLLPEAPGQLPAKLDYVTSGVGGKLRYGLAVLRSSIFHPRSSLIICGHINLLPVAFVARLICRAPVVLVIHGIDAWQPTRSWLANRLVPKVNAFISVSEFTKRRFLAWAKPDGVAAGVAPGGRPSDYCHGVPETSADPGGMMPPSTAGATPAATGLRNFILPNCVALAQFTPGPKNSALLERHGLRDRTVLLTVARLSTQERYKGIDEVLEILPALAREIPNLSYLIVGDGTDRARLEQKAVQLGVKDRVVFAGWVSNAETVECFRLADAFVMPGRGEGFGIVYLEALACGVPVVASKADASAEVVRGCELATVADPNSPAEIKSAIVAALKMKRGVRPAGIGKFSQEKFNERCGEIMASLGAPVWSSAFRRPGSIPAPGRLKAELRTEPRSILVFRIGQLGDTIVSLPAMWAVRRHFPAARLTLLCDRHPGKPRVLAADLLRGAGIFNAFESYVVDDSAGGKVARPFRMLELWRRLRRGKFDTLVYLAPSTRQSEQVERDRRFFSATGIKHFIGMGGFVELPRKFPGQPLGATLAESDLLLARLAADGIPVPAVGEGSLDLGLGEPEEAEVNTWLAGQRAESREQMPEGGHPISDLQSPISNLRPWIGVGPGSKMPAKLWPVERFREVVANLIRQYDVWPVVFGGAEDRAMGRGLLAAWDRGHNAAGALSLRGSTAALKRCAMFLGNDTGTMHLAAAAGVPCVAVFSAREWPGMWYPYGVEQKVLRSEIECEGCGLVECVERKNECLNRIQAAEVLRACEAMLVEKIGVERKAAVVHG